MTVPYGSAGHQQFLLYHFVVVFAGCFPASVFALPVLFSREKNTEGFIPSAMKILFWIVMIVFTIVTTKIAHYSSLAYFPLSFLGAKYIYERMHDHTGKKTIPMVYLIAGIMWSLILLVLISFPFFKEQIISRSSDLFAVANMLASNWEFDEISLFSVLIFLTGIISAFVLFKKGNGIRALYFHYIAMCISLAIIQFRVLPEIERLSQGVFINEIEKLHEQNIPVITQGMKSYAPYYYGHIAEQYKNIDLNSTRPLCIVTRNTKPVPPEVTENAERYTRGGYIFYLLQ
ncbi:MAG: hypothetical protein H7X71_00250 [Chitinophagales bacterium]|nr:hypothetical protein [Chitinophagales bacterium]